QVAGLLSDGERIVGVRTRHGKALAQVVLSAEGISRRFCQEAGLYEGTSPPRFYVTIVWQELEAPAVQAEHVGQIATFGQRYTDATGVMGTLDMPAPGRAGVYFSFIHARSHLQAGGSLWPYLEAYKREDPHVRDLLAGSTVVQRKGCRLVVRGAPQRAAKDGFLGLGDAVTPGGQMGIVPAMYTGVRAAQVAAQARPRRGHVGQATGGLRPLAPRFVLARHGDRGQDHPGPGLDERRGDGPRLPELWQAGPGTLFLWQAVAHAARIGQMAGAGAATHPA
ncbi:MAG: hypothetical protein PVF45_12605, partial [Anaerolineae bacterium]